MPINHRGRRGERKSDGGGNRPETRKIYTFWESLQTEIGGRDETKELKRN